LCATSFSRSKNALLVTLSPVTNSMNLSTEWEAPMQQKPHCSRRFTVLDSDLFTRDGFRLIRLQGNAADESFRNIESGSPIEEPKSIGQAHDPGGSAICMTNLVLFRPYSAAGASEVCIWASRLSVVSPCFCFRSSVPEARPLKSICGSQASTRRAHPARQGRRAPLHPASQNN